jgi:hypothetical protein
MFIKCYTTHMYILSLDDTLFTYMPMYRPLFWNQYEELVGPL